MNLLTKLKPTYNIFKYELIIFLFLILTFILSIPKELHGWTTAWYAMDYSLGIDSRLLIGSLLRLVYPDFLDVQVVNSFVILSTILLLILLSCVLGYAIKNSGKETYKKGLLYIVILYLICPGSPAYLWSMENYGRLDLYLLIFTAVSIIIYYKVNHLTLRLILVTFMGLLAISTHQVFMFIFFPLLFTIYLDSISEKKGKTIHKIIAGLCILSLAGLFLFYQFFSGINVSSLEGLVTLLSGRTNLPINEVALKYEYFTSFTASFHDLMLNELAERIRYGIITLFLLTPLWAVYGYLWVLIIKQRGARYKYIFFLLSHLCFLPAFLLTIDWGRWFGAFITVQALQLIMLSAKKDAAVISALTTLSTQLRKHPIIFIIFGIWMAVLQKFQSTLLPDAPLFFTTIYRLYKFIF